MLSAMPGTFNRSGIEYNELPPPQSLIKAMKGEYAIQFRDMGTLKVRHISYHRQRENKTLGDPRDGKGLFHVKGHPYTMSLTNPFFPLCMCLPVISSNRLVTLADGEYDSIVVISNTEEFLKRLLKWSISQKPSLWLLHCGVVKYNRGSEVTIEIVKNQKSHHNVFQKDPSFSDDKEYRIALIDVKHQNREYVDVSLGNCNDIVTIHDLPNQAL